MSIHVHVHPGAPLQLFPAAQVPVRPGRGPLRVSPAPPPPVPVIGVVFLSGDGAGRVGGAPDGVLRGSGCAEIKRTWRRESIRSTEAQTRLHSLPQSRVQVSPGAPAGLPTAAPRCGLRSATAEPVVSPLTLSGVMGSGVCPGY